MADGVGLGVADGLRSRVGVAVAVGEADGAAVGLTEGVAAEAISSAKAIEKRAG